MAHQTIKIGADNTGAEASAESVKTGADVTKTNVASESLNAHSP